MPQNPPSEAHGFAILSMLLRDIQISKLKNKFQCLPNPGYAPDIVCITPLFDYLCFSVDGGWSTWSPFTSCTSTCGGGTRTATRTCDHPVPENNGRDCLGSSSLTEACNSQVCEGMKARVNIHNTICSQA